MNTGKFFCSISAFVILITILYGQPLCEIRKNAKQASNTRITFAVGKAITLTSGESISKKPKIYALYTDPVKGKSNLKAPLKVIDKISSKNPVEEFNAEWKKKIVLYNKKDLKGKVISTYLNENPTLIQDLKLDKLVVVGWDEFSDYDFYFMKPVVTAVTGTLATNEKIVVTGTYFGTKAPKLMVEYYDKKGKIKYKRCKVDKKLFSYTDSKGKPSAMDWQSGASEITAIYPKLKDDDVATGYLILDNGCALAAYSQSLSGGSVSLTMAVSPANSGTTSPESGSVSVSENEELAISASAAAGYEFSTWIVTDTVTIEDATSSSTTVSASGDGSVTAVFVEQSPVTFGGITLAYATGTDSMSLNWAEASDSAGTSSSAMQYHVYMGTEDDLDTVYRDTNFVKTVTGSTEAGVESLSAGTDYYFLVVAENASGSTNNNHTLVAATTLNSNITIDTTPKNIEEIIGSTDITVSTDGTTVSFSGDYSSSFLVDDIVIYPSDSGSDHVLKKVTAVSSSNGTTILTVEDGSLGEVFKSGELNSGIVLVDSLAVPYEEQKYSFSRRLMNDDFVRKNRAFIQERQSLLDKGQNVYMHPEGKFLFIPEQKKATVSLTTGLTFTPELKFEPEFDIYLAWENRTLAPDRLNSATAIFRGKLSISGELEFKTEAAVDEPYKSGKIYLWDSPKRMKFRYLIGGVPVYQEVGINFACEAEFQPKASLEMTSKMTLTKEVKCAIAWVKDVGWKTAKSDGFNKSITYSIKVKGGSSLTLKVYPEVSTRFYRSLTATLAVKPKLTLDAEAEADLLDSKLSQFTKFDLGIGADVQMGAAFQIFSKTIVSKETDDLEILSPVNIFGLPTVEFSSPPSTGDVDEELTFNVKLKDGKNNKVLKSSVNWDLSDAEHSSLKEGTLQASGDGAYTDSSTFTAEAAGTYKVYYSMQGSGFLGEMGTRIACAEVEIGGSTPGVLIPDAYLNQAIKDSLYVYGRDLTEDDLKDLTSISIPVETASLKGLKEYCTNCTTIWMTKNTVLTNLSEISGMTQLKTLSVRECTAITSIELSDMALENDILICDNPTLAKVKIDGDMPKLGTVSCYNNALTSFSLSGTSKEFYQIDLSQNKLTGAGGFSFTGEHSAVGDGSKYEWFMINVAENPCTSLSDFSDAIELYAADTQVSDCPECLGFTGLKKLTLWRCPLTDSFADSTAPALRDKGVEVWYTVISMNTGGINIR